MCISDDWFYQSIYSCILSPQTHCQKFTPKITTIHPPFQNPGSAPAETLYNIVCGLKLFSVEKNGDGALNPLKLKLPKHIFKRKIQALLFVTFETLDSYADTSTLMSEIQKAS